MLRPPKFYPDEYPQMPHITEHMRSLMWHFQIPASCITSHTRSAIAQRRRLAWLAQLPTPSGHIYTYAEIAAFLGIARDTVVTDIRIYRTQRFKAAIKHRSGRTTFTFQPQIHTLADLPL